MREALCRALSLHAGRELTPEVARSIVLSVMGERAPIDLTRYTPQTWGDYVIQAERFADVLPELHPLHVLHWRETEGYRHGLALDPDYAAMVAREEAGGCLQLTVRHLHGMHLRGHLRMWISSSLHTKTLYADEDTLFLDPHHRGSFLVMALMRYAEACVLPLGVREIRANSKKANKAGVLMRRLGYDHVADQFVKVFPEEQHEPA